MNQLKGRRPLPGGTMSNAEAAGVGAAVSPAAGHQAVASGASAEAGHPAR